MPGERKGMERMAARLYPERVQAARQRRGQLGKQGDFQAAGSSSLRTG